MNIQLFIKSKSATILSQIRATEVLRSLTYVKKKHEESASDDENAPDAKSGTIKNKQTQNKYNQTPHTKHHNKQ